MGELKRQYIRGDRRPALKIRLVQRDSQGARVPADITAATSVLFTLATLTDKLLFASPATILDAPTGLVAYEWQSGDLDRTPGEYRGWVTIDWGGGATETKDDITIEIRRRPA